MRAGSNAVRPPRFALGSDASPNVQFIHPYYHSFTGFALYKRMEWDYDSIQGSNSVGVGVERPSIDHNSSWSSSSIKSLLTF